MGAQAIKREEIEGKLALSNSVLNRNQVRDSLDKIKQLYLGEGLLLRRCRGIYADVGPEEIDLTIRITEGRKNPYQNASRLSATGRLSHGS